MGEPRKKLTSETLDSHVAHHEGAEPNMLLDHGELGFEAACFDGDEAGLDGEREG